MKYTVNGKDKLIKIDDIKFESAVGGDVPLVFSDNHTLFLAYYVSPESADALQKKSNDVIAFFVFENCYVHIFGAPNIDVLGGHSLYSKGLKPWCIFEVKNSSWIKDLEKSNSIHQYHDKKRFMKNKRHFIFSFHDSTFECIAENFVAENYTGSPFEIMQQKIKKSYEQRLKDIAKLNDPNW